MKKPPLWKYILFRILQPFLVLLGIVKLMKMAIQQRVKQR